MQTIYEPRGCAKEYAKLALELYRCNAHDRGGCIHGCNYPCYVPGCLKLTPAEFRKGVRPREGIIEALKEQAPKYRGTRDRVLLSFFSDPYQKGVRKVTRYALVILRGHGIPFLVLTKGGTLAAQDFDLYGPRDGFGVTLTTLNSAISATREPLAASPLNRLTALGLAKSKGIHTFVSLEPVIDPAETLRIIEETHDLVDHYNVGKLNHNRAAEAKIDWRLFGAQAIKRLECFEKTYTIKDDLRRYLDGIPYTQTEHRTAVAGGSATHRGASQSVVPGLRRPAARSAGRGQSPAAGDQQAPQAVSSPDTQE